MATAKENNSSRVIAIKLAKYLTCFYIVYYIFSIIFVGAYHVGWKHLGIFPFWMRKSQFNPSKGGGALGTWLAMVLTHVVGLAMTFSIVRVTKKSWDFALSTAIVHFVLCIIVNQAFPVNWIWWVTLGVCVIGVSIASEFLIYFGREMRDIKLDN
uniref:Protein SYS1 homolog n=1 Tax=Polytomella parva TaxID=51329 RepID=A0A7S0V1D6_9CHLO|mmetsp:Transcript_28206/g.51991  ORF Transcript_28206/g.51991 Transcript_28206/m.51991 type:complete len:155 (+) Transcript_28206:237-701(+)